MKVRAQLRSMVPISRSALPLVHGVQARVPKCRLVVQPPHEHPIACDPLFSALPRRPGGA